MRKGLSIFILFLGFYLLAEFVLPVFWDEQIVWWKSLSIALIAALSAWYSLRNKGLSGGDLLKYFSARYPYDGTPDQLLSELKLLFPEKEFIVKKRPLGALILRKVTWQNFGERISLKLEQNELKVKIKPRFGLDLLDQGQAYASHQKMKAQWGKS